MRLETYEFKAQIVKALAHPLRLAICEYLLSIEKPKCVNHIAEVFGKNQSVISKHLSILQQASIVKIEKEGIFTRYAITDRETISRLIELINRLAKRSANEKINLIKNI